MVSLLKLVAPPPDPREIGTPKSWGKIESRLGSALPPDYKNFIDHYGTGSFDDFIIIFNPFAENEYLNLFFTLDTLHQAEAQTHLMGDPVWTAVHPFALYPTSEGLLPWGCTTNLGDFFFWQIKGPPQTWETILYNLRSGEYEVWKFPMADFLYQLFSRKIASVLLPDDYPSVDASVEFIPA